MGSRQTCRMNPSELLSDNFCEVAAGDIRAGSFTQVGLAFC